MIYRYTWTIPIDPRKHFELAPRYNSCLNGIYFKRQFGQLHALVSICRQVRQEVLSEYFDRTQVYVRWRDPHVGLWWFDNTPCPEFDAVAYIQSSRLLTHYTHHVSLHWVPCLYSRDSEERQTNNCQHLDWLLKLEQLKTLELVLYEGWIRIMAYVWSDSPRSNPGGDAQALFCSVCLSKLMELRNLKKVVFKVDFGIFTATAAEEQKLERSTRWFARIKKQVSNMILKAPSQVRAFPSFFLPT